MINLYVTKLIRSIILPRLARLTQQTAHFRPEVSAKTLARITQIMKELNWDAVQVIECAVDLLYTSTSRKDLNAHALTPKRPTSPNQKGPSNP